MRRGLFITGTDTGVGKTVLAAAVMHRYRREAPVRYWKPIQTGIEQDDDTAEVARLGACSDREVLACGVRLTRPLSPHLAARLSGTTIDIESLVASIDDTGEPSSWIVEGAGGVLVPLNDWEMMIDVMTRLQLPVLIAARSSLGTINHTLLTLEALRSRALRVAGVVMIGDRNEENRAAIERYGRTRVVGEIPRFPELTPAVLASWSSIELDRDGHLEELLR
jgi:dethiobiotin synthase